MTDQTALLLLRETLETLQADPEGIDWPQRRAHARVLMDAFKAGGVVDREVVLVPLLNLLADDPKWEVRKVVADDLHYVRQTDFERLVEKLCQDDNSFVRRAAENSQKRRRKVKVALKRRMQGIDLVLEQYQWLKEQHGEEMARTALMIGESYHMALASNIAHEMKNDLSVLQGRAMTLRQRVADRDYDSAFFQSSLDKICGILGSHESLVQQMLEYARSRTTPTESRIEAMDEMAHAAMTRLNEAASAHEPWRRVQLEADVQKELYVSITRSQMEQAVFNILKNAFEAVAAVDTPRVVVTGKAINRNEVALAIEDNGLGIGGKDLEEQKVFVPGRTTKRGGSGFGLVIARNYVEKHDGNMVFESEPGVGTTVTIILPRAKVPSGATNA